MYKRFFKKTTPLLALIAMFCVFSVANGAEVDFNADPMNQLRRFITGQDSKPMIPFILPDTDFAVNPENLKTKPKEWTVMVFLSARNDLERFAIEDINEMEKVGSDRRINIVVQFAGLEASPKRYYIDEDQDMYTINSTVVERPANVDMGSWKHLVEFAKWTKAKYPAKRYMLVVWNHGDGWKNIKNFSANKGIAYDDITGNYITTEQLGFAMKEIGRVDIISFDACLMQMAEVAYEIKNYADVILASEETEPGAGYPYDKMLPQMIKNPSAPLEQIVTKMIKEFHKYYYYKGKASTHSALRTGAFDGFANLLNEWADAAVNSNEKSGIKSAVSYAKSYAIADNKDLYDFIENVNTRITDSVLIEKGKRLQSYIKTNLVIYSAATLKGSGVDEMSHGIAVYLPGYGYSSYYDKLTWARDARWDEFLKSLNNSGYSSSGSSTGSTGSTSSGNIGGCVDPGETAPLSAQLAYLDCLLQLLNQLTGK